jgi:hypothetical protein
MQERLCGGRREFSTRYRQLFFQLLFVVEAGVVAIECKKFFVAAKLDNSAAIQDGNLVGVAHG